MTAILADHRAESVKTLGDAVILRGQDPGQAIGLGLRVVHEIICGCSSARAERRRLPIDAVCRMTVEPDRRAGWLVFDGVESSLCSVECGRAFAGAPDRYMA